ncbi:helix-turn-helix domain-containing protein [Streptomyces prasinopilosus]|uniref:helix-turn-helix domain-containing protein n=1 Tax=Streptomyces prasinopilosus TaxID=67344 RepID=UPI0012FEB17D|nr:helix-turn-helix transcriptional regulator [Streptomyces prasinopilosus]
MAANIKRIRKARGLSVYTLSDRLRDAGRTVAPSAISKVERCERQVHVDELVVFAAALDVSPSALLLPPTDNPSEKVEITGAGPIPADQAWDWMDGRRRLDQPSPDPSSAALLYLLHSRPPIRRNREIGSH